jgi:hypothetical protein
MTSLLLVVFIAGAAGGVINALISDNGFALPRTESVDQVKVLRPGFLGNILIGGIGAVVSWGLYGPLSAVSVMGQAKAPTTPAPDIVLTLASLVGAVLVGVGGARWLTNEVDKKLLKAAAAQAALGMPSSTAATSIAASTPANALKVAAAMKRN